MVQRLVVRAPLLQQLKIEVVLCCSAEQGINQSPSTIHKLHGHMCNFEGFSEVSPFTIVSWLNFMRRSASCKLKTACALLEVVSESARSAWTLQMVHRAQHVPLAPDQCYTRWKVPSLRCAPCTPLHCCIVGLHWMHASCTTSQRSPADGLPSGSHRSLQCLCAGLSCPPWLHPCMSPQLLTRLVCQPGCQTA